MEENEGVMYRAAKSDVWKFVWRSRIFGEGTPLEVSRKAAPGHDEGRTFLSGQFYFFRSPALLRVLWCEFPLGTPWESSPCPSNRGAHGEDGQRSPHFQPAHLGSCLCPSLFYMSPSNSTYFLPMDSGGADF